MSEDASALFVPLQSNGASLLSGKHVTSVRRRLKYASLSFERICLEEGVYILNAWLEDLTEEIRDPPYDEEPRWQTPAHRRAASIDYIAFVTMCHNGKPPISAVSSTEFPTAWEATLRPFANELSASVDWIEFIQRNDA